MSERPVPAPVSDRAALLSALRTGGVQPKPNRHSMPAANNQSNNHLSAPAPPGPGIDNQMANLQLNVPSSSNNRRASGDGHAAALNRIKSAQYQAAARHAQPSPQAAPAAQPNGYLAQQFQPQKPEDQDMLAQQLATQQQLQQAELLRLLALQRQQQQAQQQQLLVQQQQQLMLLQALQAQAASQQQALHAHPQYDPSTYDDHLSPNVPIQRHSWNPDTAPAGRRAVSGRLPAQRSTNTLSVGPGTAPGTPAGTKPRAVSSADMASSWRTNTGGLASAPVRRSPTPNLVPQSGGNGPNIVVDDESRRPRSVSNVSSLGTTGLNDPGLGVQPPVQRRIKSGTEGLSGWLQPMRQPRGPPTDPSDLETQNFVARRNFKTRRDALKVLTLGRHGSTEGSVSTITTE